MTSGRPNTGWLNAAFLLAVWKPPKKKGQASAKTCAHQSTHNSSLENLWIYIIRCLEKNVEKKSQMVILVVLNPMVQSIKDHPKQNAIQETTYLVQVNFGTKNFPPKVSNLKI